MPEKVAILLDGGFVKKKHIVRNDVVTMRNKSAPIVASLANCRGQVLSALSRS